MNFRRQRNFWTDKPPPFRERGLQAAMKASSAPRMATMQGAGRGDAA